MPGSIRLGAFALLLLSGCALFPNDDLQDSSDGDYETVVGPEGLTLSAPNDDGELVITAGALTKSTTIGFQKVEPTKLADLPSGLNAVSRIYELTPHGLELENSVDLKMPHTAMRTEDVQVLRLADAAANTWTPILEGVVIGKSSVKLSIDHFSYYVVVEVEDPTATVSTGGAMAGGAGGASAAGGAMGIGGGGAVTGGIFGTAGGAGTSGGTLGSGGFAFPFTGAIQLTGGALGGCTTCCTGYGCGTVQCGNGTIDQASTGSFNGAESCDNGSGSPQPCADSTLACVVADSFSGDELSYIAVADREVPVLAGWTLGASVFGTSAGGLGYSTQDSTRLAIDVEVQDNGDGSWSNVVSTQTVSVPAGGLLLWRGGSVGSADIELGSIQDDDGTWVPLPTDQTVQVATGARLSWLGGSVQGPASVGLERRKDGNGLWQVVPVADQSITVAAGAVLRVGQDAITGPLTARLGPVVLADGTLSTRLAPQRLNVAGGVTASIGDATISGPVDLELEERSDIAGATATVLAAQAFSLTQGASADLANLRVSGPASVTIDSATRSAGGFGVTVSQVSLGIDGELTGDISRLNGPVNATVERRNERLLVAAQTLVLTGATSRVGFAGYLSNYVRGPASVQVEPRLLSNGVYQMVAPAQTLSLAGGGTIAWGDGVASVSGAIDIEPKQETSGQWRVLPTAQTVTLATGDTLFWSACEDTTVNGPAQIDLASIQNSAGTWQALPIAQTLAVGVGGQLDLNWTAGRFQLLPGPVTAQLVRKTTSAGVVCALVDGRVDYGSCASFPEYATYATQQDTAGDWSSVGSGAYCVADTQCSAYADCGTL